MRAIDVVILTGGQGSRLRTVVRDRPKTMARINGRPFLDVLIKHLKDSGFNRFILCVGYMAEFIKNHYRNNKEITFSSELAPLGTGGAVKNAGPFISSETFLVVNGDSFCPVELNRFVAFHKQKGSLLSMALTQAENSGDFGSVVIDASKRIIQFNEKAMGLPSANDRENPPSPPFAKGGNSLHPPLKGTGPMPPPLEKGDRGGFYDKKAWINAGVYLFEKKLLSRIPPNIVYSLEYDLFPQLVGEEFYGFVTKEKLIDIGTPERLEEAKRLLLI